MSSSITNVLGNFGAGNNSLGAALKGFVFKNLTYPDDINNIGGGHNHAAIFNIYTRQNSKATTPVNAPNGRIRGQQGFSTLTQTTNLGSLAASLPANQGPLGNTIGNQTVQSFTNQVTLLQEAIVLYMPHNLQTTDSQDWTLDNFTNVGQIAQSQDVWDVLKNVGINIGKDFATKTLGRIGAGDSANVLSKTFGRIINPYYELIYNGTQFRTFEFAFKFTPQVDRDAIRVRDIIRTFRYHQAPEIDSSVNGRFLLYPSEFRITFLSYGKENQWINKIGRCVLTSVTTNYTGGTVAAFHPDGSPVSYNLNLTFQELEIVTKEKIGRPGEPIGL